MHMTLNLRSQTLSGVLFALGVFALVGCSSGEDLPDAGPMVHPDATVEADAGVRALCPVAGNNPTCQWASECQDDRPKAMRCEFCPLANDAVCKLGQCEVPDRIEINQTLEFFVTANDLEQSLMSFARVAVTAETSGGNAITCDDILNERLQWTEECYNIIDSRYNMRGSLVGGAFKLLFSQIPGGQRTLLVVYGFDTEEAMGDPIGVACVEADVPAGGSTDMIQMIGGEMKSLR